MSPVSPGATDPLGAVPDPDPLGARVRLPDPDPLGRGAAGGDGTRPGCAGPGRRGGAGFEGAGEGRRRVGRWQGGITNPVKIFSKIKNPLGP